MNSLTYKQAVADIIERLQIPPDSADAQRLIEQVKLEQELYSIVMERLCTAHGGWMLMTAFTVSFIECKQMLNAAEGKEKEVLKVMLENIIGSFGKSLN